MIFSFVSRYNQAGKSEAVRVVEDRFNRHSGDWQSLNFADNLNWASGIFVGGEEVRNKYEKHPVLGVSLKDVNHIIADALQNVHPELSVYAVKEEIVWCLENDINVLTSDTRREREFIWLDDIAAKYGTKHHIIRIMPVRKQLEKATLDTWSNGVESCGYEAWADRNNISIIFNDGTAGFEKVVVHTIQALLDGKERVICPF